MLKLKLQFIGHMMQRADSLEKTDAELKLQYFGRLMWRANSLEKSLMLGKMKAGGEGGNRGWDGWMASLTQWTRVWANSGREWRTGNPGVFLCMGSQRVGHKLVTENNAMVDRCPLETKAEYQAPLQTYWGIIFIFNKLPRWLTCASVFDSSCERS